MIIDSKLFITILFSLAVFKLNAQIHTIPFHNSEITVDGILNEDIWTDLSLHDNFHNYFPVDEGRSNKPTSVRIFQNGKDLYVGVEFQDSHSPLVSSLKRDDYVGTVLQSDCFQLILDPFNEKSNGYMFSLNTSNTQLDALISYNGSSYEFNESWSTIWESKVTRQNDLFIFEMKIPLKALAYDANNSTWGINFIMRTSKPVNNWTSYSDMTSNFNQFDLRGTLDFSIENLPKTTPSKLVIVPSTTYNFQKNVQTNEQKSTLKPSLDAQYNITTSLRLDATINPDFSQIDVDEQITNLTRFDVFFPERRNFFLENGDLFSNLGTDDINPFYSRRIGAKNDILFGLKLSGNLTKKTRVGLLNTQTDKKDTERTQNYGALVLQQQLSNQFSATGFILNRQETDLLKFKDDYNRVTGINLNYKSTDNKWIGLANIANSYSDEINDKNQFYNLGLDYSTNKVGVGANISSVGRNYLTDIGFTPRLYNYDAANNELIREGFTKLNSYLTLNTFPNTHNIQQIRYLRFNNSTFLDETGNISQSNIATNHAVFFQNTSSAYISLDYSYVNLKYGFNPLQNSNLITPDKYNFGSMRIGYNSPFNRNISFRTSIQHGGYYGGYRTKFYTSSIVRLLPIAKLGLEYDINYLNLNSIGKKSFHLARLSGEIFFNNRINWTTYIQYNTQQDNFNINSRFQWEYRPLSYLYFVITDNYNETFEHKNWGVALKVNYRLDL